MPNFICVTCGTQFADSQKPPDSCPICNDQRQYVGPQGQQWTTLGQLRTSHRITVRGQEPNLIGIGMQPEFAIGQRALLIVTKQGNVLWDCISLVEDSIVTMVRSLGGLSAIAISHPHYYASMVDWSRAFNAPVYLHGADRQWVMRPDPAIQSWDGDTRMLLDGVTLVRCGGHFDGGTVLHWQDGADGRGVLLSGDIIQVVPDSRYVSFLYSYPNLIPLPAKKVRHIARMIEPYSFERIYGAWWGRVVARDGNAAVARSAERYLRAIGGNEPQGAGR